MSDSFVLEKVEEKTNSVILADNNESISKRLKLSARERLEIFSDLGSFQEIGNSVLHRCTDFDITKHSGDGVITGICSVFGQKCAVFLQDFSVLGGSLGEMHAKKICNIMDIAANAKIPIVGINDSGGARIQEGVNSLSGYGEIFQRNVNVSGYIPQISLIMGPCAGGAVYSPALTDFTFMTKESSFMFVTGPNVVKAVTHEDLTKSELGGSQIHSKKSGVADLIANNDIELLEITRNFLSILPPNNDQDLPNVDPFLYKNEIESNFLNKVLPRENSKAYNMKDIIRYVIDFDSFFEIKENFATNIIVGFAKIGGRKVGIVANQPNSFAGCLDIDSSCKAARFVRFCDAFNIPLITFVDTTGFLPGSDQEYKGIIRHGAKLVYAFAEATVQKITIITRKAYGGAYIAMSSKHLGADFNFAWPDSEIAVMGVDGAAQILFKKYAQDPEKMQELVKNYSNNVAGPKIAAAMGYIDEVIQPSQTRKKIINALNLLQKKGKNPQFRKKHDNLPL